MFKNVYKKIVTLVLIVAIVVPISLIAVPPKKAEASFSACIATFFGQFTTSETTEALGVLDVPVFDLVAHQNTTVSASQDRSDFMKDCIEHGLALAIGKMMLSMMTDEIVTWINSGFEGKPAFVTDPKQFLVNIGDQVAGEFIAGSGLAFLCSPFKLQVQIQLALDYSSGGAGRRKLCSLSDIINNVEGAFTDFSQQNWEDWFQISQNESNNPYGSYLKGSSDMGVEIAGARNLELLKLNWSGGFLSWSECTGEDFYGEYSYNQYGGGGSYTVSGESGSFSSARAPGDKCTIQTPGRVIANQLDNQLGIPAQQLGLADDLDKIFNALANQVFKAVISSAGGLLGSTASGSGGGSTGPRRTPAEILRDACTRSYTTNTRLGDVVNDSQAGCVAAQGDYNSGATGVNNPPTPTLPSGTSEQQNVALRRVVTASSVNPGNSMLALVDGNRTNTYPYPGGWDVYDGPKTNAQNTQTNPPWIQLDLDRNVNISRLKLFQRNDEQTRQEDAYVNNPNNRLRFNIKIYAATATGARGALVWTSPTFVQNFGQPFEITLPANIRGQFVRIDGLLTTCVTGCGSRGAFPLNLALQFPELEVYENNPPIITVTGANPLLLDVGDTYLDPGATAVDERDGTISSRIIKSPTTINTSAPGEFTIRYNVTDSQGLAAVEKTRTVRVGQAAAAPLINLVGGTVTITQGGTYIEPGYSAVDGIDGFITQSPPIMITGTVNTSVVGTYTLRYNFTNSRGINAPERTRTVIVQ